MYVRGGGANVLVELASTGEHYNRNLGITQNGELVGLLEKPIPSFRVSDLAVRRVLYPLDLDLTSSHDDQSIDLPSYAAIAT